MESLNLLQKLAVSILPILFAITIPSGAKSFMAYHLGDRSQKGSGRMTLAPQSHIDFLGSLVLPAVGVMLGGFIIGWPKTLHVDIGAFRKPRHDLAKLALVTPLCNLLQAFVWGGMLHLQPVLPDYFATPFAVMCLMGVQINVALMIFSLIPLPPLPGAIVLQAFLSPRMAWQFGKIEAYSFWILLALMFTGVLGGVLLPLIQYCYRFVLIVLGF